MTMPRDEKKILVEELRIVSLVFHEDGQVLFAGEEDGTVGCWDPESGKRVGVISTGYAAPIWALAVSKEAGLLAVVPRDNAEIKEGKEVIKSTSVVELWDLATLRRRGRIETKALYIKLIFYSYPLLTFRNSLSGNSASGRKPQTWCHVFG